jgi:hypothetical protein
MKAHLFDLDSILNIDNRVWIIDKSNPNIPLLKISQSDFNLIRSGIFKNQGNKIVFGSDSYWIPVKLMDSIKIKCKNTKSNISNLGFSMQEFMNDEIINGLQYQVNLELLSKIKNTNDHLYIICSKNSKRNYQDLISKIEEELKSKGIIITNWYFISETFYNRKNDEISFKKVRLVLQHIIGLKTDDRKFTDEEITKYSEIFFYDIDEMVIENMKKAGDFLQVLLSSTDDSIKSNIKEVLKSEDHIVYVNQVTENKINKVITTVVHIAWSNLIRAFESFKWSKFGNNT